MSEEIEYNEKSTKDLRTLAGEHNITNRSRLGRDGLIEALKSVQAQRTVSGADASGAQPALAPQAEPEVIDPAAVAYLSAEPVTTPASIDDADGDDDGDDGDDDGSEPGPESLGADGQPITGLPGEGGRRRRRRRRGGRGGRGGQGVQGDVNAPIEARPQEDGQPVNGQMSSDLAVEGQAAPLAESPPAPSLVAGDNVGQPDQRQPQGQRPPYADRRDGGDQQRRDGQRRDGGDQRRDGRDGQRRDGDMRDGQRRDGDNRDGQRRDGGREGQRRDDFGRDGQRRDEPGRDGQRRDGRPDQQQQQQNGNRPQRPRLDGPQRPVTSVLDRLCSFTRGVLELCDPSTPTWAQARLSELLAEAGLSPIPCVGPAHPDFHTVVGTVVSDAVPAGHIAVVDVPGFALRGDRGDLFPLRKAQVRVTPARETAPVAAPAPMPVVTLAVKPVVTPVADVSGEPEVLGPDGIVAELATPAAPQPPAAPRVDPPAEGPDTGFRQPAQPATTQAEAGPCEREEIERENNRRRDGGRSAPREERPRDDRPRDDRPRDVRPQPHREQGSHINRTVPASVAPALPLVMQQAEELAARPKAEAFRALGLNDQIIADLAAMGFNEPTPIQTEGIPVAIAGKDMIGQAQTGTGKTAAFVLPLLNRLYQIEGQGPVALVLTPTRELAKQVHDAFCKMAGESGARAALIYGGVSMDDQFDALDRKPHVVIGTPGRIIDHVKRRTLDLSHLAVAILDEADQMLDIGFWPDVMWIMSHTPPMRQTLLFSATFPDPIRVMAEKHMRDPVHVRIKPAQVTVEQVDQKYIAVSHDRKTSLLAHFIETQNPEQLVVFCRTKHQTDRVAEVLKRKNLSAGAIHGDLPQNKRERMLLDFRNRELQCLIATNVAARGLDIPSVSHVVNYDIPENPEEYVHRIGRTARNGARGVARTFITPEDGQFLLEIEKHIGLELEEEEIDGFTTHAKEATEIKRTIADMPVGTPRLLKPLVGGIKLGRRR